jgi:hypothetical protein
MKPIVLSLDAALLLQLPTGWVAASSACVATT